MVIFQAEGPKEAANRFTKDLVESNEQMMRDLKKRAIVIDASALTYLTTHPDSLQHFINVSKT